MPSSGTAQRPKLKRSLVDFALEKKREHCPVCKLPSVVLEEIKLARGRKMPRSLIIEWLTIECGYKVTASDFDTHHSARHV